MIVVFKLIVVVAFDIAVDVGPVSVAAVANDVVAAVVAIVAFVMAVFISFIDDAVADAAVIVIVIVKVAFYSPGILFAFSSFQRLIG